MKNVRILLIGWFFAGLIATQATDRQFVVVDYLNLRKETSPEQFITVEKLWQRRYQKEVDKGFCRAWCLARAEDARVAKKQPNQFVTIRIYDSLDKAAALRNDDDMVKGLYTVEEEAMMSRTIDMRDLTRSEIWVVEAAAVQEDLKEIPGVLQVDFMQPLQGKAGAYYDVEKNFYQKIHEARIQSGQMVAWSLLRRMFSSGADAEYNFVAVNAFGKDGITWGWDEKLGKSAVGEEAWKKAPASWRLGAGPTDLRTMVRREFWHPLLRTTTSDK